LRNMGMAARQVVMGSQPPSQSDGQPQQG
jgi:hypothetical protein